MQALKLEPKGFALVTCHRAENTDSPERLKGIFEALAAVASQFKLVLPLHPRTKKYMTDLGLAHLLKDVVVVDPLPFLDMVALEQAAKFILTDSGGVQKEAFFYGVPCITMRDETEWVETVETGWNCLVGASTAKILEAIARVDTVAALGHPGYPYGDGQASQKIIGSLLA